MNALGTFRTRAVGLLLVTLGVLLFLRTLDIVTTRSVAVGVWSASALLGGALAVRGWARRSSGLMFVGAFLFAAGLQSVIWTLGAMVPHPEELLAGLFLWIGLAALFVWLPAPHRIDLLAPVLLFGGAGAGYYLWWWDIFRAEEVRDAFADGWPVLLMLIGGGVVLRSVRRTARQ